ncbi:MAG: alpha-L-rhamnosidase N-terminal domain-containing protein [Lentisphaeria bacterium]|nr:alpha-L-rhamnosidase N-terminal domain-containing protein [Lentisphaeria bacterium]
MCAQKTESESDGSWIWLAADNRKDNRIGFFRKEFVMPESSEFFKLQISALPFYHVYLNGEHVGCGPSAATYSRCYVDSHDITQYLIPGINTIGIIVPEQNQRYWHSHSYPPKVWCRLTAGDDEAIIHTDSSWKAKEADCYMSNQPRRHSGMDKVEKINLDTSFTGWTLNGYDDRQWESARELVPFMQGKPRPVFSDIQPLLWTESETFESLISGTFTDTSASAFFAYDNFPELEPGNYAAETFAYSPTEKDIRMDISSDDPFAIFCNDNPVAFGKQIRHLDKYEQPDTPRIGDEVLQSITIHLQAGWNRFLCFQEISSDSMGMMLLFPNTPKSELVFRRENSIESLSGWKLCGPLRTPLLFSSASFSMKNRKDTVSFLPLEEHVNDISAYLGNCEFSAKRKGRINGLRQGEFAIYDLGEFRYGFPILDIDGSAGDIVDVTCGLRLSGDAVRSIGPLGRMTDTLLLSDGNNPWMRLVPRGARYVMISVRKAADTVVPVLRFSSASSELGSDSEFSCSDEICNSVWELALASLRHCANQNIIDDPSGRRCQTLPEAYIYSKTLHYLFGGQEIVGRALREFAEAQLENGMIMKTVPSGVYSYSPGTALLWILWLENHWDHTGNTRMLESLIPCLDRLLNFFRMIPPAGDVLLPSGRAGFCSFLNECRNMKENGIFIPLNALYYRALKAAARLYGALNQDPQEICLKTAKRLGEEIIHYAQDPETGLFADFYDGEHTAESSFRTNIMVLNSGLISDLQEARSILEKCCSMETILPEIASPFFSFVLETLSSLGRQDLAIEAIRAGFHFNKERMNLYERGYNPHIFNIAAGEFLIREMLGVRASAPGFAQIYFNPACSVLSWAKCRLPSAKGKISVEWVVEHHTVQARIESTGTLDVLPLIPPKFGANFNLGNHVNLLDPNS